MEREAQEVKPPTQNLPSSLLHVTAKKDKQGAMPGKKVGLQSGLRKSTAPMPSSEVGYTTASVPCILGLCYLLPVSYTYMHFVTYCI